MCVCGWGGIVWGGSSVGVCLRVGGGGVACVCGGGGGECSVRVCVRGGVVCVCVWGGGG